MNNMYALVWFLIVITTTSSILCGSISDGGDQEISMIVNDQTTMHDGGMRMSKTNPVQIGKFLSEDGKGLLAMGGLMEHVVLIQTVDQIRATYSSHVAFPKHAAELAQAALVISLVVHPCGGTPEAGQQKTKEEDVASISTSVYVTNFLESISAKDLFKACMQYGHVVDSFIPNKKSKNGKRFGFVKFINVFSEKRLINNLCTVWIDRFKLHANIARFQRPMGKKEENGGKKPFVVPVHSDQAKKNNRQGTVKSYRGALNGDNNKETMGMNSKPSIVLGEECETSKEILNSLFGRLLDVDDQDDLCFHSKRLCVHMKSCKSIHEEFKIIHRGRGYWIRANETPEDDETNYLNEGDLEQKSAEFEENSDEEIVPDTIFEGDDVEKRVADEKKEEKE
nr:nucleotide-binding alpha-beta plait domain-containing protein [Tanacetum cinerariifolium]